MTRGVTPAQFTVCTDLLSRAIGLNCYEDTVMLVDSLTALVAQGERGTDLIKWLSLLPRARGRSELVVDPVNRGQLTIDTLPPSVQHALRPVRGEDKTRSITRLATPDAYARKIRNCTTCGVEFDATPGSGGGRPAVKCETHRAKNPHKRSA